MVSDMQRWLPLVVFVVILGCARVLGAMSPESLGNLQPYGALFFCGMACFGARWIWVPTLAWFLSVPLTSAMQGYGWSAQILVVVAGFAAMIGLARFFRGKSVGLIFAGSMLGAVAFYLVTNSLSWAFAPGYPKSLPGLVQALWTGLPGFEPTWMFFRNSLISQAVFTLVFLMAYGIVSAPKAQKALVFRQS